MIEIPKNAGLFQTSINLNSLIFVFLHLDPFEDQFEKRNTAKKERVAKNELQRLRNIARRSGKKVPGVGETLMPNKEKSISEVGACLLVASIIATFHQTYKWLHPPTYICLLACFCCWFTTT